MRTEHLLHNEEFQSLVHHRGAGLEQGCVTVFCDVFGYDGVHAAFGAHQLINGFLYGFLVTLAFEFRHRLFYNPIISPSVERTFAS